MNNATAPFQYSYVNSVSGMHTPSMIHVQDSLMTAFFRKYLLQKALSVYEWKLPDNWSKDYFLYTLYGWGYLAVIETDKFGVIPQQCGLRGYDIFYRPTHALITNPLLKGILEPKINTQCVVMKLQPDYSSILDLIEYYAGMMALSVETASMNLTNSKMSWVGFAGNKSEAETFKKLYDEIMSGNPAVVTDKSMRSKDGSTNWQLFNQNVGQNYIVGDILTDLRKWENMFNTDVGIENTNTEKKERLITAEVEANNEETISKGALWLEGLQESCQRIRDMFGIEISVDWRVKKEKKESVKEVAED